MTVADIDEIERTRATCEAALAAPDMRFALYILERRHGMTEASLPGVVSGVAEDPSTQTALTRAIATVSSPGGDRALAQRAALLCAARQSLSRLPSQPLPATVRRLFCAEFSFYAADPGEHARRYVAGSASLVAMCKTATLRRFPAGQFDWEVSGIRRSDLLKVTPSRLPAALTFVIGRMRGLGPVFFSHLNWRRPSVSLSELEANRSYYRMARAMELQPDVRGFGACSWFRSPATHRVSPHLSWLSRVVVENGGFVAEAGQDDPGGGVLHRSATRRRLFEEGRFRPTKGLVMWPRDALIAWADRHPEFGD